MMSHDVLDEFGWPLSHAEVGLRLAGRGTLDMKLAAERQLREATRREGVVRNLPTPPTEPPRFGNAAKPTDPHTAREALRLASIAGTLGYWPRETRAHYEAAARGGKP